MERLPVPHVYHAEAEDVHGGACKQYFSEASTDLHGAAACCVLAMLPIIALYIFLNKYFIKGAVDSAVK